MADALEAPLDVVFVRKIGAPGNREFGLGAVVDGIATGGTIRAVLTALSRSEPARLVLAVPVAPPDTLEDLAGLADEIVCLTVPDPFHAVGAHYEDLSQTSDAEVVELLSLRNVDGVRKTP